MKEKLISVIVPVYNAEKYIKRCIDSILDQTYKDLEIVLVNDGSKDNSLDILKSYEQKFPHLIKVYSQENQGEGGARNTGIKNCTGQYYTFVDADDSVKPNAVQKFIDSLDDNTDIVIGGFESQYPKSNKIDYHVPKNCSLWTELKYNCTAFKMYRTDYIKNNNFKYKIYPISCDVLFNVTACSHTDQIKVVTESTYINYINNTSVTATIEQLDIYNVINVLKDMDKNAKMEKYPTDMVMFFYLKNIVQNVLMQVKFGDIDKLNKMYLSNYKWISKKYKIHTYWQKGESTTINMLINAFIVSTKTKTQKVLMKLLKKLV